MATDPVERFRAAALGYCELLDGIGEREDLAELLPRLLCSIADVYIAALALYLTGTTGEEPEVQRVTDEEWTELYDRLREVLGASDTYFATHEAADSPSDVEEGSLADDLADIYRDLKAGLGLDSAGLEADAVFEWAIGFWSHWGLHAADAMRALHVLIVRRGGWSW